MNASRFLTGAAALSLALTLNACGGEDETGATPVKGRANASSPAKAKQQPGRQPGDTSLPKAAHVNSLPEAQAASGLVLVQRDAQGGCTVLTYGGGQLKRLGTFPAIQAENTPSTQRCDDRAYATDFRTRVQETGDDIAVQTIDGKTTVITKGNNPVIGPDNRVYATVGGRTAFTGKPFVMNLDGSDPRQLENGKTRPGWLGGQLVDAKTANHSVYFPASKTAVEYISSVGSSITGNGGYRVGEIQTKGYGPAVKGDIVFPTGGEASKPLAVVGDSQFLTSVSNTVYINTFTTDGAKPAVTVKPLATLPPQYGDDLATDVVNEMTVCGGTAYFTVALGGTTTVPEKQSVVLGLDPQDGTLTAHASVLNTGTTGTQHYTTPVGCVQ